MESDCRKVVDECLNPVSTSPLFGLLMDVLDLASFMEVFSVVFCPRSCNKVADRLAKHFCSSKLVI